MDTWNGGEEAENKHETAIVQSIYLGVVRILLRHRLPC